jgi:hypothetical protein
MKKRQLKCLAAWDLEQWMEKGEVTPITASTWRRKLLTRLAPSRRRNAFKKMF